MTALKEEIRFRNALAGSWPPVHLVGLVLQGKGSTITIPGHKCRPSLAERDGYGDDCDLIVDGVIRLEIKQRGFHFTCKEDFPYRTLIVDRVGKADLCAPRLTAYINLNQSMTHVAIIDPKTKDRWIKRSCKDPKKDYIVVNYECPIELVEFKPLSEISYETNDSSRDLVTFWNNPSSGPAH